MEMEAEAVEKQSGLASAIDVAGEKARYDECAKKLLSYKAVAAWILKSCAGEFAAYSPRFIQERCLPGEAELSARAVHQDHPDREEKLSGDSRVELSGAEASGIKEQTVYFDIRFNARIPSENPEEKPVQVILNLEVQGDDSPGYPLVARGYYYCARMISEQYGTVFQDEEYQKMRKVYSIWICPDPAKRRRNGILRYHTQEEVRCGRSDAKKRQYDLMEVVIVNLGEAGEESGEEILDLLNTLFSPDLAADEKKKRLEGKFGIAMTEEINREVERMSSLGQAIEDYALQQGEENRNISIARMMIEDNEPMAKIMRYTGYAAERVREIAKKMGRTVSY